MRLTRSSQAWNATVDTRNASWQAYRNMTSLCLAAVGQNRSCVIEYLELYDLADKDALVSFATAAGSTMDGLKVCLKTDMDENFVQGLEGMFSRTSALTEVHIEYCCDDVNLIARALSVMFRSCHDLETTKLDITTLNYANPLMQTLPNAEHLSSISLDLQLNHEEASPPSSSFRIVGPWDPYECARFLCCSAFHPCLKTIHLLRAGLRFQAASRGRLTGIVVNRTVHEISIHDVLCWNNEGMRLLATTFQGLQTLRLTVRSTPRTLDWKYLRNFPALRKLDIQYEGDSSDRSHRVNASMLRSMIQYGPSEISLTVHEALVQEQAHLLSLGMSENHALKSFEFGCRSGGQVVVDSIGSCAGGHPTLQALCYNLADDSVRAIPVLLQRMTRSHSLRRVTLKRERMALIRKMDVLMEMPDEPANRAALLEWARNESANFEALQGVVFSKDASSSFANQFKFACRLNRCGRRLFQQDPWSIPPAFLDTIFCQHFSRSTFRCLFLVFKEQLEPSCFVNLEECSK